jgi:hypothetical protein
MLFPLFEICCSKLTMTSIFKLFLLIGSQLNRTSVYIWFALKTWRGKGVGWVNFFPKHPSRNKCKDAEAPPFDSYRAIKLTVSLMYLRKVCDGRRAGRRVRKAVNGVRHGVNGIHWGSNPNRWTINIKEKFRKKKRSSQFNWETRRMDDVVLLEKKKNIKDFCLFPNFDQVMPSKFKKIIRHIPSAGLRHFKLIASYIPISSIRSKIIKF